MLTDKQFLIWIHDRLKNVYGENPRYDYMYKLRAIIEATPEDYTTYNDAPEDALSAGVVDEKLRKIYEVIDQGDFALAERLAGELRAYTDPDDPPYELIRAEALLHFMSTEVGQNE